MKTLCVEIKEDVKSFVKRLSENLTEFDVYLGGGYLRDKYVYPNPSWSTFNKHIPKDVDIFLVPKGDFGSNIIPLSVVEGCFVQYSKDASDISDMEERGVSKLYGLRKHTLSTQSVQLIVYSSPMTQEALCKDMDMNINQVMWCPVKDVTLATEAFVQGHEDKVIECLHTYDTNRTYVRYERMKKKFTKYTTTGMPAKPQKRVLKRARSQGSYGFDAGAKVCSVLNQKFMG